MSDNLSWIVKAYADATAWSDLWKRAATKYWRKDYYDVNRMDAKEIEDTATRLRGLLRRLEWSADVVGECPLCGGWKNGMGHAADCELAEELGE